jgi:hypothetical protein
MRFLRKLQSKEITLRFEGKENAITQKIEKFFELFFKHFMKAIFEKNYDRNIFPIFKSNSVYIYENSNFPGIDFIFIKSDTKKSEIILESEEGRREGSLIDRMLKCEIEKGKVIWGITIDFYSLNAINDIEKIVEDYISQYYG